MSVTLTFCFGQVAGCTVMSSSPSAQRVNPWGAQAPPKGPNDVQHIPSEGPWKQVLGKVLLLPTTGQGREDRQWPVNQESSVFQQVRMTHPECSPGLTCLRRDGENKKVLNSRSQSIRRMRACSGTGIELPLGRCGNEL